MSSRFSISVPVGAWHPLLADCLQSLAIQSPRPNVALLDASGDPLVKKTADEFSDLFAYRRHGPDKGQTDAILEGWGAAPGDILGWLNADDALYPGALAAAAERLAAADAPDVVYGHSVIVNDEASVTGYHWAVEPPSDYLLAGDIISQPSCFFRRDAHDRIGGLDSALHYTMDWDLWVRLWRAGAKFAFIDRTMSRVLWTREAKTGGFGAARRKELERIINQNASPWRRMKSRAGFALHHLFEYVLPAPAARALRGRLAAGGAFINGLGRNGEIETSAAIPLVHYRREPVAAIIAEFETVQDAALHAANATAGAGPESKSARLDLPAPWPAGETLHLTIKNAAAKPALLTGLRFE